MFAAALTQIFPFILLCTFLTIQPTLSATRGFAIFSPHIIREHEDGFTMFVGREVERLKFENFQRQASNQTEQVIKGIKSEIAIQFDASVPEMNRNALSHAVVRSFIKGCDGFRLTRCFCH
mmetsp:Transcript_23508/g.58380  ORF Transcript_23508/g.58380 Transcript_23508/m.58380 type:complete len:121 (+) Transcript_23508:1442-1804(+)